MTLCSIPDDMQRWTDIFYSTINKKLKDINKPSLDDTKNTYWGFRNNEERKWRKD